MFDFTHCYGAAVVLPCKRIADRAGALNVAFNVWCGLRLLVAAVWLLWELWTSVAPRPITDDFRKLLDDFLRDQLGQSADLALVADRVGVRLHVRGRGLRAGHRAADVHARQFFQAGEAAGASRR